MSRNVPEINVNGERGVSSRRKSIFVSLTRGNEINHLPDVPLRVSDGAPGDILTARK